MTYLEFHLVFLLPPLALLLLWARPRPSRLWAYLLMPLIALLYTTPWDNYLVWQGIWGYPEGRVLFRIGYVPFEEYLFFLLQPLLTGALLFRLAGEPPRPGPGLARVVGGGLWLLLTALGVMLLALGGPYLYLGLILAYFAPVFVLQWAFGGTSSSPGASPFSSGSSCPPSTCGSRTSGPLPGRGSGGSPRPTPWG
ncbi:lycopene cyclase domain-containing protein [Thermus caldilimi]|uniref:lycopene cyclase domain-containing protein n=1 Tax=Thermus caldilimi TaxID=2483360 RepID=UPI001F0D26C5|nr:lycopene cyclase domain-containing protein [Thermus caldilimi]